MLVGDYGIPGFCTGIDPVKQPALGRWIVSGFLVAFRPVRIFDGDAAVRIGSFGRSDDPFPADLFHQVQAVFLPASVRDAAGLIECVPFFPAGFAGAVCEEEVIDNKFMKVLSEKCTDVFQACQHLFVVVAEGVEEPLLGFVPFRGGDGGGQAAGDFHTVFLKGLPAQLHMILVRQDAAPEGLEVDFVHFQVFFKECDILFQLFLFRPGSCLRHKIVYELKIPVIAHRCSPFLFSSAAR